MGAASNLFLTPGGEDTSLFNQSHLHYQLEVSCLVHSCAPAAGSQDGRHLGRCTRAVVIVTRFTNGVRQSNFSMCALRQLLAVLNSAGAPTLDLRADAISAPHARLAFDQHVCPSTYCQSLPCRRADGGSERWCHFHAGLCVPDALSGAHHRPRRHVRRHVHRLPVISACSAGLGRGSVSLSWPLSQAAVDRAHFA